MCFAILKPADQHITRKRLRKGFQENPDGAGFMYVGRGRLRIKKGYFTFKGFYKSLRNTEKLYPKSNFVIHFRLSTSGKTDYTNCHPFFIDKQTGFVHNGIFKGLGNKIISDTLEYNFKTLQKLPKDFIYSEKILAKIDKYCGWGNKLIFLNNKNDYYIVNECVGKWENNIWYSTYDVPQHFSVRSDQWFDREKYEDESVAWDTCDKCGGFYPVNELVELSWGGYHCLTCSVTQYKNPHYCYYCGNAYIETEEGMCTVCGTSDNLCYGT